MQFYISNILRHPVFRLIFLYSLLNATAAIAQQTKTYGQSRIIEIDITEKISPALGAAFGLAGLWFVQRL